MLDPRGRIVALQRSQLTPEWIAATLDPLIASGTRRRMSRRVAACCSLALALARSPARAAGRRRGQPQTTLPAMEQQVMCVVCRTPLAVANGPQADAERRQIRRADRRRARASSRSRTRSSRSTASACSRSRSDDGFNLAVYLVPVAAVALALALLALALPRWRRQARARAAAPAAPAPAPSAEDMRRLDEDLARHD